MLWSFSLISFGQTFQTLPHPVYAGGNGSDEDTILIEREQKFKISYSRALKAFCKQVFKFDIDQAFSTGKNKRSDVIRQLDDLSERTHYSMRLEKDEITLKFSLNL
jgi:hypothetical protein